MSLPVVNAAGSSSPMRRGGKKGWALFHGGSDEGVRFLLHLYRQFLTKSANSQDYFVRKTHTYS